MPKIALMVISAALYAGSGTGVFAQDVLMNSAETINQGNIKLAVFPTVLLPRSGGDPLWGVAGRAGMGITPRFDIEVKAATFKGLWYFGADAEYWLVRGPVVNLSAAVGGHFTDARPGVDSSGIDTSILVSTMPAGGLEFYGGVKFAFDSLEGSNGNVTRAHIVPGIEFRLSQDLDLLAEVGIALNDRSRSYASVGIALYLR